MQSAPAVDMRQFMSEAKFYESYSRFNDEENRYETWNEAVDRVIDMHAGRYADKEISHYLEEVRVAYREKRVLGAQRSLQFGGDQILKHQMKMYNCFSKETRFLTSHGMKSFGDYNDGDNVIVKTHTGAWKNAKVKSYGDQPLNKVQIGKTINSLKQPVYVTANHRWLLEGGASTTNLSVGDVIFSNKQNPFLDFDWEAATDNEKLYWCYGYIYGDGTTNGKYSHVRLCGKDVRFLSRFEEFGWKTSSPNSIQGDVFVYTGKYQKTLPDPKIDSIELIRAFCHGYLSADGTKGSFYYDSESAAHESHFTAIYAKKVEAQEFIKNVFPLVGIRVVSYKQTNRKTNFGIHDGLSFGLSTFDVDSKFAQKTKVYSIEATGRVETVWCLEVEDDASFVLEYDIVTGNCTSSYADRAEFFGEIFYILLCGAGAGFSVQKHHIAKLPQIAPRKKQPKTHVVTDDIEGWGMAVDVLLSSYFVGGGKHPEYEGRRVYFDTSEIRNKGAMISGGFKAPGPDGLRLALDRIEHLLQQLVLMDGVTTLEPVHVYDIIMHLADAVLSGGVRRSATICLFSLDDKKMLAAKTGDWYITQPQRKRSNNSAVIVRDEVTYDEFMEVFGSIKEFGEPGFVFVDSKEHTTNPCVEIGMFPQYEGKSGWQGCNLTEINGGMCDTKENFFKACRASAILGTLQAGYTDFKFLSDTTKKIFEREALLGCSITGWMNSPDILFDEEILKQGAQLILKLNKEVAKVIGINPAARATCVKPSGNASVILKTASGIHGEHAPIWIRHVTMNKESEVAQLIAATNPAMVEESHGSASNTDYMIAFPVISPENSIYRTDLYDTNLLEKVKLVQENWVEYGTDESLCVDPRVRHNVSNTVSVKDWDVCGEYVFENRKTFAGISFMANFGDKAFDQAPFTALLGAEDIVHEYGSGAILGSGLVVDALDAFDNLWTACATASGYGEDLEHDSRENSVKRDWVRRLKQFADNYVDGDLHKAEDCLKDVYLHHKWKKIVKNYKPIDWTTALTEKKYTDVDTLGAQACAGGECEIDF